MIIGLAFKDYCPNQKDIDYYKSMIEQTTDGKNYEWKVSPRCKLSLVSIDGVSFKEYVINKNNENERSVNILVERKDIE